MVIIYVDLRSGNCLKVEYTTDFLSLPYEWVPIDLMAGQSRTAEFLAINPAVQVSVLLLAFTRLAHEGGFVLEARRNLLGWIGRCEEKLGLGN